MTLQLKSTLSNPSDSVHQVAQVIRTFNAEQLVQLINLVPALYQKAQQEELFIAGLSYQAFFALSTAEKNRLWQEALRQNKGKYSVEQTQTLFEQLTQSVCSYHHFVRISDDEVMQDLRKSRDEVCQT